MDLDASACGCLLPAAEETGLPFQIMQLKGHIDWRAKHTAHDVPLVSGNPNPKKGINHFAALPCTVYAGWYSACLKS